MSTLLPPYPAAQVSLFLSVLGEIGDKFILPVSPSQMLLFQILGKAHYLPHITAVTHTHLSTDHHLWPLGSTVPLDTLRLPWAPRVHGQPAPFPSLPDSS